MMEAFSNLSRPDIRKPFILVAFSEFIVAFSGPIAIIYYSVGVFENTGVSLNKYLASIIVAAILVMGGTLGTFLIQRLPRVRLAMVSMTLMSVSMAVLGGVLYIKTDSVNSRMVDVVPVISVTLYMFSYGAGVSPLQGVFLGELLPREYNVLAGVIKVILNISLFISTKTFLSLLTTLSPPGTYWLFAAISLSSNLFYFFFMPETKGKTVLEVKQMFSK